MSFEFHEAANIFPIDQENIQSLAEDIKKNGQQIPIELLDGKILDGRRRSMAVVATLNCRANLLGRCSQSKGIKHGQCNC